LKIYDALSSVAMLEKFTLLKIAPAGRPFPAAPLCAGLRPDIQGGDTLVGRAGRGSSDFRGQRPLDTLVSVRAEYSVARRFGERTQEPMTGGGPYPFGCTTKEWVYGLFAAEVDGHSETRDAFSRALFCTAPRPRTSYSVSASSP
jgi:hypothetical protein